MFIINVGCSSITMHPMGNGSTLRCILLQRNILVFSNSLLGN